MNFIEVSIPFKAINDQLEAYSLSTTDFDLYRIPAPVNGFKGGIKDDVLIYFADLAEMVAYTQKLGSERNVDNSTEPRTLKLQRIIDSIGLIHPIESKRSFFTGQTFIETRSGITYTFKNDTLILSGKPYSSYKIIEQQGSFYLDSQLDNTPLLIDTTDLYEVKIINPNNNKLILNLQKV